MAFEHELDALAERRPALSERARAMAARVFKARTIRAYRRVLLGEDGKLTAEAAVIVADLMSVAGMGRVRPDAEAGELQFREGQRAMVLHLFARMDPAALRSAAARIREIEGE